MAAVAVVISYPPPSSFLYHYKPRRRTILHFRCSAGPPQREGRAPQLLKLAVSGLTELLRILTTPNNQREEMASGGISVASNVDEVVEILQSDYQNAYFLTGKFTSDLYSEDCLFEDPTISFRGKNRYSQNLDLLIPFFDCPSLKLEKIEKGSGSDPIFVVAKWKLRTYLKFPWRPLISITGSTIYDLDEEFRIVRHSESWNVSALEAVGQIFAPGFKEGD